MIRASRTGTGRLVLRQLVTDGVAVATVGVIVLVCAAVAAAVPRSMDALLTAGLRQSVTEASSAERDLTAQALVAPPSQPGSDPLAPTRTLLEKLRADLPPLLREATGEPSYEVTYRDFGDGSLVPVLQEPKGVLDWDVATMSGLDEHVRYVAGRAARTITTTQVPGAPAGPDGGFAQDPVITEHSVVEVAVSDRTAADAGVAVGSRVDLPGNLDLLVVGVFEAKQPDDPYWGWSRNVLRPPVVVSPAVGDIYQTVAVVSAGAWRGVERQLAYTKQPSLLLRIPVEGGNLQAADAPRLLSLVRQVESTPRTGPGTTADHSVFAPSLGQFRLLSNLDGLLLDHLRAQAASTALVSLVVSGLLGASLAVLALAARLVVEGRRTNLALAVARGASPVQVAGVMALEGLAIGIPAALLGAGLAAFVVDGEPGLWGVVLPAVLALAPAVLLPLLARPGGVRVARRDVTSKRVRRFRLAGEGLVVALAAAALVLVRRRGLGGGSLDGAVGAGGDTDRLPDVGVDPLLAAAPVLIALALALLLVRLYPQPVTALARAAARRRGVVPFLGAARAGRDAAAGTLPLVVLLLALATSVFGAVVTSTSDHGAKAAAAQAIGAPARISGVGFSDDALASAARIPGVEALSGLLTTRASVISQRREADVPLAAVDARALTVVQREVPGAVPLEALADVREGQVPVVLSRGLADVGEVLDLEVDRRRTRVVVVGTIPRLPGVLAARPLVVADRATLLAAQVQLPVATVALLSLEATADAGAVQRPLRSELGTYAPLTSQADAVALVRGQPLVSGTLAAFPAAFVLGAALSGAAVVLTLVVGAPERTRLLSRLRTLGMSQRQARGLTVWELTPLLVTGLLAGAGTGLLVAWWLLPAIDLRAFTGGTQQPALAVDVPTVLGMLVAFALVTAALVVAAARSFDTGAARRLVATRSRRRARRGGAG
jgi:putative ABC transport system permease protein